MKLRTRLMVILAVITLVVAVPAIYAVSRLSTLREIASEQRTRHAYAFLQLGRLRTSLAELDRYERGYLIAGGAEQRIQIDSALNRSQQSVTELTKLGYGRVTGPTAAALTQIRASTQQMVSLMEAGRAEEATAQFESIKPQLTSAQDLGAIGSAIDERSKEDIAAAHRISASAATTTLLALLICVLIAVALGVWASGAITKPVVQLRRTMGRVAEGDFALPEDLPFRRQDEIGDLARSFGWMTHELHKLDQMKAEFISIATHELKTPINVISGYAELIEEGIFGTPTQRQREALETIREQTRVLTNLVNQLLDISRLEAGGLQLEMQEVLLRDLFTRIERSFTVLARKKEIDLRVDVEDSVPRAIHADGDRLGDQVLGNLLSNALKFTPEGGRIHVRSWAQHDGLHIEVKDSGVGVPPDQLPYIFDKYYQIGQQARSKGAGLGLAIAREIVEAHGGWITVQSEPGEGTTFVIVLPTQTTEHNSDNFIEKTA